MTNSAACAVRGGRSKGFAIIGSTRHLPTTVRLAAAILAAIVLAGCGVTPSASAPASLPASSAAIVTPSPAVSGGAGTGFAPQDGSAGNPDEIGAFLPDPEAEPLPAPETTPVLGGALSLSGPSGSPWDGTISATGGTLDATFAAPAAGAISLEVPAGAFAADTAVTISTSAIGALAAGAYGGVIRPVTPLYTIDLGVGEPLLPLTVTLDYKRPAGAPPGVKVTAFYYDSANGQATPLTPLDSDGTHIRALATHFSAIFGAIVDMAKLPAIVDSGFRPGTDDWQFPNYGSYIAARGHCEGQSLSAIWYYNVQRRAGGASPLYGLYDNNGASEKTPAFWYDDSQGYRFASAVQASAKADRFSYNFFRNLGFATGDKQLIVDAFRLAIGLSGQPQLVGIWNTANTSGHAMIVYRVSPGRIYVADPNYPRALRTIAFNAATGQLGPYNSGDSVASIASAGAVSYTRFAYVPAESSAGSAAIAANWAAFEANTAGQGVFPGFEIYVSTEKNADGDKIWSRMPDGYTAPTDTIDLGLTALSDGAPSNMRIYRAGSTTPLGPWEPQQTIKLEPGDNQLGFLVYGKQGEKWKYVNFVRLTIRSGDPEPSPSPSAPTAGNGEAPVITSFSGPATFTYVKGKTYGFTVTISGGTAPYHYKWLARGTPLVESDGGAKFTQQLTADQVALSSNGGGYYISLYVTDSANRGVRWFDPARNRPSGEFIYAIEGFGDQTVVHYPPIPYTPAP